MASLLSWLGNTAGKVERQVNPFDHGATASRPAPRPAPAPVQRPQFSQQAQQAIMRRNPGFGAQQIRRGPVIPHYTQQHFGVLDKLGSVPDSLNQALNTNIAQPFITRPAAEVVQSARDVLNHGKPAVYHPQSNLEKQIFGNQPVQSIQQKVGTQYKRQSTSSNSALRLASRPLAAGEAALSVANDVPVFGGLLKGGTKVAKSLEPSFAGLKAGQVIMDTKKLDALHNYLQPTTNVHTKQSVIDGLHQIKQDHGLDFITGSPESRRQRISQYLEQNGEAIPQLQAHQAKMANVRNTAIDLQDKFAPGLRTNAVNDKGESLGLNGKPLKAPVTSTKLVPPPKDVAPQTPKVTTKLVGEVPERGALANDTPPAISRFPARLMEDNRTVPIQGTLLKNVTHEVKHNAPVLEQTAANIVKNEDAALSLAKRGNSTEANATAMQLLNKYLNEGSFEKADDLVKTISPRFTRQGQETQILAAFSKLQPAGAVRYAARQIEKATSKTAKGQALENRTTASHKAILQTAQDLATQLQKEINTRKLAGTLKENTPKTPEQMLADRIKTGVRQKKLGPDPIKDMVDTLHKVAKEVVPGTLKSNPRNPMELIGKAIKDKAEYSDVWDKAQKLVAEKYKDNPHALEELDKYFSSSLSRPFSKGQLNRGVQQGLKGVDLGKLVKDHYSKVDEAGMDLKQKLIKEAGLSDSEATQLSGDIQKRYDELVQGQKESIIKQMFGDRPTPEQKTAVDRVLTLHNLGALSKDEIRPLVAQKLGIPTLTPEMAQHISGMAEKIQTLPEGSPERQTATAEMMKFIADSVPQSAAQKGLSVWKAGLLSSPLTHAGNIASNETFNALKNVSNPIAAGVDRLISLGTHERTKVATLRGVGSGTRQGFGEAKRTLKTGIDSRNIQGNKYEIHGELNFKNPVVQKVFGNTSNGVFRMMSAGDQPVYYRNLKQNLYDIGLADGKNQGLSGKALNDHAESVLANPSENIAETAKLAAQKSVLSQDSKIASSISRIAQEHPALQAVVPFVKVPTNFLSRTLDFSPVGLGKAGVRVYQDAKSGKGFDQRALSEAVGEGMTGTGIIAVGTFLANNNLLSGQYPTGDQKEAQRWKAEGIQPNSVKLGSKWINLNYLGPVGLLLGAGKDFHSAAAQGDNGAMQAIAGFGKGLAGQSFLTGFSGAANAINDPGRYGSNFVHSQAASVVPAWLNTVGNMTDSKQRQADNTIASVGARIPGVRNSLPVKNDVYGNALPQRTGPIDIAFNPLKPSNDLSKKNPVVNEVNRLHFVDQNNSDLQVTPVEIKKTITIPGATKGDKSTTVKINDQQKYALQKQVGQATQANWAKLIQTPEYQAMSDIEKAKALNGVRQDATELATRQYVVDKGLGTYAKAASAGAIKLADGDLSKYTSGSSSSTATKDYYKSPDAEYKALLASSKTATYNSPAAKITADAKLAKAKVGAGYDKSIRDAYDLSNAQLFDYVHNDPNGNDIVKKVLAYSQALKDAGITSTAKFMNKYGQVTLGKASGGSSSGGRRRSSGRTAKVKTFKPVHISVASKSIKAKSVKAPSFKAKRSAIPKLAKYQTPKVTVKKKVIA